MNLDHSSLLRSPVFTELDRRFARFLAREAGEEDSFAIAAAALVSSQLRRGHVFLDLNQPPAWENPKDFPLPDWPDAGLWRRKLEASSVVGTPGEAKPLLLTASGKLYLHRYWLYEKLLADKLRGRSAVTATSLPDATVRRLDELFSNAPEQKEAARNALLRPFSVISGGPGTGKTTTVLKILILLFETAPGLAVHLAAPTGKAAARLQESVREGIRALDCPPAVRERVEEKEASTIHRLLGSVPGSVFFRHNAGNPLATDVLVVDEASMVDLPLMAKLFDALPPGARVILLGDKDQLASVEAGSVLSGIVEAAAVDASAKNSTPLAGAVTLLNRNFRFGNEGAIFRVCSAVREGKSQEALDALRSEAGGVTWRELPAPTGLKEKLRPMVVDGFRELLEQSDPAGALSVIGRFQILTALRGGPYGKENINLLVEEILREEGLIPPARRSYSGRPLMVTENDYAIRLFNGDVGVLLEEEKNNLMAFFPNEDGGVRKISPLRLPSAESAFAMTVHKSQGSEFDEVLIILPARDTPVLTRELIYTAISRARKRVELWCGADLLEASIKRRISRGSGLVEVLSDSQRS